MSTTLESQLATLQHGDHLCLFPENFASEVELNTLWMRESLKRGERCIYVSDAQSIDDMTAALTANGIDVARELCKSNLVILGKWEWRESRFFDSDRMAKHVKAFVYDAIAHGYEGAWVNVEMTRTKDPDISAETCAQWEDRWNNLLLGLPIVLFCSYNREQFPTDFLLPELHSHPLVIHERTIQASPYYRQHRNGYDFPTMLQHLREFTPPSNK